MLRAMRKTVPLGRFGNEAETSAAIVFLLSPAASFISGSVLRVDGARPQVRMGWPIALPDGEARAARGDPRVRRLSPRRGAARVPGCALRPEVEHERFRVALERAVAVAQQRRAAMLERLARCARWKSAPPTPRPNRRPVFDKRGQLLPRERVALLLDPGHAVAAAVFAGRLSAGPQGPGAVGAGRRRGRGHRLRERRALHGGGQRFGHRGRRHPAHGPGQDPARAGDRAAEQAALHPPGGERGRQSDALPRRGFRARRRACSATSRGCRPPAFR